MVSGSISASPLPSSLVLLCHPSFFPTAESAPNLLSLASSTLVLSLLYPSCQSPQTLTNQRQATNMAELKPLLQSCLASEKMNRDLNEMFFSYILKSTVVE